MIDRLNRNTENPATGYMKTLNAVTQKWPIAQRKARKSMSLPMASVAMQYHPIMAIKQHCHRILNKRSFFCHKRVLLFVRQAKNKT